MRNILFVFLYTSSYISPLFSQLSGNTLFDNSYVHEIHINAPNEAFWQTLTDIYQENYKKKRNGGKIPYYKADIIIDGDTVREVGIRQKGHSSYSFARKNDKKPLKVDFNAFVKGTHYRGLKKINLHNGAGRPRPATRVPQLLSAAASRRTSPQNSVYKIVYQRKILGFVHYCGADR